MQKGKAGVKDLVTEELKKQEMRNKAYKKSHCKVLRSSLQ